MACHRVISETPEQPTLSTVDIPEDEKHSCWLSEWLSNNRTSISDQRFVFSGVQRMHCADHYFCPAAPRRLPQIAAECLDRVGIASFNPEGSFPAS